MPGLGGILSKDRTGNVHVDILQDNKLGWESVTDREHADKESSFHLDRTGSKALASEVDSHSFI